MTDYYAVLCIDRKATLAEIKKAYRSKAIACHPDKNKKADAEQQFIDLTEAYEVLRDHHQREHYDRLLEAVLGNDQYINTEQTVRVEEDRSTTYKVCRKMNIVFALLGFLLFIDLLVLPKIERKEKIVARKAEYYRYRDKYSGRTITVKSDQRLMITEHYKYPIETYQLFEYWKCDSIRVVATPILRMRII